MAYICNEEMFEVLEYLFGCVNVLQDASLNIYSVLVGFLVWYVL